jgi:hypothetical protein
MPVRRASRFLILVVVLLSIAAARPMASGSSNVADGPIDDPAGWRWVASAPIDEPDGWRWDAYEPTGWRWD